MFDVGFSELMVFGIIALVVLGPEKLPHAARMAGAWYARIRKTVAHLQAEISQEVYAAEVRAHIEKEMTNMKQAGNALQQELNIAQAEVNNTIAGISDVSFGSTTPAKPLLGSAPYYYLLQGKEQAALYPPAPLLPRPYHYV